MAWSTLELADLARTTVKTVRHYHRLGLLEEPERLSNGYKQYRVRHLIGLLRIRRLAELGVPLSRIEDVRAGGASTPDALREIDAELAAEIERQQKARDDIAEILRESVPADTPAGFESVASRLSEADRTLLQLYAQFYDEEALADLRQMVDVGSDAASAQFDALPVDADDATRQRVAEELAPTIARHLTTYPWLMRPGERQSVSERVAREMFIEAVVEVYNSAQLEALARASIIATEQVGAAAGGGPAAGSPPER